jgi:transposase
MYLMTSTRCGISAKQLERELGVTYKTAWRMFTLIRNELMGPDDTPLSGEVEMDEMFIGGKPRNDDKAKWAKQAEGTEDPSVTRRILAHKWSNDTKVPVFGMAQRNGARLPDQKPRGGKVAAYVVPSIQAATLSKHMDRHVAPDTKIFTDEGKSYRGLRRAGWDHETVNHTDGIYVSGNVHTQTIEGFWSLVKRGIDGTHHAVSAKWLQGYVNEYVWRYNRRDDRQAMFLSLVLRAALSGR